MGKIDWFKPDSILRDIKLDELEFYRKENQKRLKQTETETKTKQFNQIVGRQKEEFKMKIKLENVEQDAIKDLGTNENIINKEIVKQFALPVKKIEAVQLKNIFGNIATIDKSASAAISIEKTKAIVDFLVSETEKDDTILLGKKTICEFEKCNNEMNILEKKFKKLFSNEPSDGFKGYECQIHTTPNKSVYIKYRDIPNAYLEGSEKTINGLLRNGYIEPSESSWANPIRPVLKPNGEIRITSNMQFLNNLVEDDNYTVPNIQRILEKTQGKKFFTVIDLKDGYYQINLKKEHRFKTAFHFNNRLYQWTRMPQGFKNSPAIFQRIMDNVLKNEIPENAVFILMIS